MTEYVADRQSNFTPPAALEYLFYVQIFYAIMGGVIGPSINLLGAALLAGLGGLVIIRMERHTPTMLMVLAAPLGCAVTFVAVQVLAHQGTLGSGYGRDYIPWAIGLVIVQYLAFRPGFFHRFALAIALIGFSTLPYLRSFPGDETRLGLSSGIPIGNPNDLGAWFGFSCVYFTILGFETRRNWIRVSSWGAAAGCLLVVGLTVSRAPLFAVALSLVIAFRRVLKKGFLPFLVLIVVGWIAYGSGVFERSATMYAERGLEDSGRMAVWPLAIARFVESPWVGVGADEVATSIGQHGGVGITPHNGFIFVALCAGIVPLLCFVMYWVRGFIDLMTINAETHPDAPFHTSLLVYSLLIASNLNEGFMVPWIMGTLATVTATAILLRTRRAAVRARPQVRSRGGRKVMVATAATR